MERWAANTLRTLGILVTTILVIGGCCFLLLIAGLVFIRGGLTPSARILRPQASDAFFGAILATIALVTAGVVMIVKLAKEIVWRLPAPAGPATVPAVAATPRLPSSGSRSLHLPLWPVGHKTIDRLVLALVAQIAISAVMLFQLATRASVPHNWTLMLLLPFILSEVPHTILIYVLLKRPGSRAFTFLIAMLVIPILETLFNPVLLNSYSQIYRNHAMGLLWLLLSGLIYIVTLVLAYVAIQQTGLWPKLSSVIPATTAMFFYFFFIKAITPYLYSLWK
ncbi:MAG: hypothetical protein ABSD75_12245 [Terriglobales bacterium]